MMPSSPPWEIFVVQNFHIDIGYTERQEVVADWHRQFVAEAVELALSEQQGGRPPDARFKFTCEGFWQVEQFLKKASEAEVQRLVRAMRMGLLELSAFYVHLNELLDEGHLRDSIRPARQFAERHGIPLKVAMSCDVNGFSWAMADALYEAGVRYLSANMNPHHGGYAFGRPLVPFYWETPRGSRLLVWSGYSYHKANLLGLIGGPNPDVDPGVPGLAWQGREGWVDVRDTSMAEAKLLPLLESLKRNGYPYDFLLLAGSGVYADNGPAGDLYCDIIQQWNRKFGTSVHVRTATLLEYFEHVESRLKDVPTVRGHWPDWWSEGVASTPLDTLLFRNAQRVKRTVEMLDPHRRAVGQDRLDAIAERVKGDTRHIARVKCLVSPFFSRADYSPRARCPCYVATTVVV